MITFQQARKYHHVTRRQLAQITDMQVDELWALEETGRGTEETWQAVIKALNQLTKFDYEPTDFSGMIYTNWLPIQVE